VQLVTTYKLKPDLTKQQKREFLKAVGQPTRPGSEAEKLPPPPGVQVYLTEDGRRFLIIVPTDLGVNDPASDWVEAYTEDYKPWLVSEGPELMHKLDKGILERAARALLS
jgi:hypothetical protein